MKQMKKRSYSGNKIRAAVLGLSLMIAPGMGCTSGDITAAPSKKPVAAKKADVKSEKTIKIGKNGKCDLILTSEELNDITRELAQKCKNGESKILMKGHSIKTKSGKMAKVLRIDRWGVTFAFGEKDEESYKGKYLVATYVPFTKNGTSLTIMDPALLEGQEQEKMANIQDDLMVVVCPSRNQPKDLGWLRIVKKTWNELKCIVADKRANIDLKKQNKELQVKIKKMKRSLQAKMRKIKRNLARETDPERITELSKELIKVSDSLKVLRKVIAQTIGMEQKPEKKAVPKRDHEKRPSWNLEIGGENSKE
jgi:hypothetical protein